MKKFAYSVVSCLILSGCTTTMVVKDNSGSKIVDVLYAHYSEEVVQSLNKLADSRDKNTVNTVVPYNQNNIPLTHSYSGKVIKHKKIIVPDTYPQKKWRTDKKTYVKKITNEYYKNQGVEDRFLTSPIKGKVNNYSDRLKEINGKQITINKKLRDDMEVTQKYVSKQKKQLKKEIYQSEVNAHNAKKQIKQALDKEVIKAEVEANKLIYKYNNDSQIKQTIKPNKKQSTLIQNINSISKKRNPIVVE